jgi:hypothetical protein
MSWCRWGSPCDFTFPIGVYKADVECAANGCPGSDLYIYEDCDDRFICCGCRFNPDDEFVAKSVDEMLDHIEAHHLAGHHVRQSLLRGKSEISEEFKGSPWDPSTWPAESRSDGS